MACIVILSLLFNFDKQKSTLDQLRIRRSSMNTALPITAKCHRAQSPSTLCLNKAFVHTSASFDIFRLSSNKLLLLGSHAISRGSQQPEKASDNLTPFSRLRYLIDFRKPLLVSLERSQKREG